MSQLQSKGVVALSQEFRTLSGSDLVQWADAHKPLTLFAIGKGFSGFVPLEQLEDSLSEGTYEVYAFNATSQLHWIDGEESELLSESAKAPGAATRWKLEHPELLWGTLKDNGKETFEVRVGSMTLPEPLKGKHAEVVVAEYFEEDKHGGLHLSATRYVRIQSAKEQR